MAGAHTVAASCSQMDGMQAGYSARREHELQQQAVRDSSSGGLHPLGRRAFLFLSAVGDMDPLQQALAPRGSAGERRPQRCHGGCSCGD
jgi:hypothetical protein